MTDKASAYAQAGVDVDVEARASEIMFAASQKTFKNREGLFGSVILPFEDFAGVRAIDVSTLPEGSLMSMGFDTAGTKVEIAQRMNKHDTVAFDVFAMVCDDAVVRGAEPVLIGTNLDVTSFGSDERKLPILKELADGAVAAAEAAGVAMINGEIAQMGSLVAGRGDLPYHWGAALVWFARKEKMFTGREIQVGDAVVVLREHGFRANGLSLVRKIFNEHYGEEWHRSEFKREPLGQHVLTPSIIYSKLLVALHGGFQSGGSAEIHGVVHITGGGIPEKFARVLRRSGLGVELTDLFDPCPAMLHCQELGGTSDRDAYGTWNMGQGMAVITPDPTAVIKGAEAFGLQAKHAGRITETPGVTLVSRGVDKEGQKLFFS